MSKVSDSGTPLTATFRLNLNGRETDITTVGQTYDFITSLNSIEWMELGSLKVVARATD